MRLAELIIRQKSATIADNAVIFVSFIYIIEDLPFGGSDLVNDLLISLKISPGNNIIFLEGDGKITADRKEILLSMPPEEGKNFTDEFEIHLATKPDVDQQKACFLTAYANWPKQTSPQVVSKNRMHIKFEIPLRSFRA